MKVIRSLRVRLLVALIAVSLIPVGTAAFLIERATTRAFETYSEERTTADAQSIAAQIDQINGVTTVVDGTHQITVYGAQGAGTASGTGLVVGSTTTGATGSVGIGTAIEAGAVSSSGAGQRATSGAAGVAPADGLAFTLPGLPDARFLDAMTRSLLIGVAVAAVGAVLLALLLTRQILRPVESLTSAARGIAAGDLQQRVPVDSDDELGELARAFNVMAATRERLEELRRNLVNDVAHELRSPITNLQGYLEVLRDGIAPATPQTIEVLHEEAVLLGRMVGDLQDLALAEAGQLPLTREQMSLAEPIRVAVEAIRPQADVKGIELRIDVESELPTVSFDVARFRQVLRNLLNNAIAYTPQAGKVDVMARSTSDSVQVSVIDTGAGITPDQIESVFERFYRADPARARATGGSGLGLAIVKHLVEAHGGRIEVTSEVGRGSTFTISLPISAAEPETEPIIISPLRPAVALHSS